MKRTKKAKADRELLEQPKSSRRYILCPRCNAHTRKLSSYGLGIQVRRCTNGRCQHHFEIDTWMGMRSYL